jgi:hypothetical protein
MEITMEHIFIMVIGVGQSVLQLMVFLRGAGPTVTQTPLQLLISKLYQEP